MTRLGINIDHIGTLRNARGMGYPDPIRGAKIAKSAGADGITAHLREDRRHIKDEDIYRLMSEVDLPLNFEMAITDEMTAIACKVKPHACCLVPEKREELTTEGGLNVIAGFDKIKKCSDILGAEGIRVSLFIDPDEKQLYAAKKVGSPVVEIHTGAYCEAFIEGNSDRAKAELAKLKTAIAYANELELECHAGHGITYDTIPAIASIPNIAEFNIGHFLIGEALFIGLEQAIIKMKNLIEKSCGK